MQKIKHLFILVIILSSCTDSPKSNLIGTWEIQELRIKMNSFQNGDEQKIIEATAANWEEKMQTRNIQTTYNADGTYHSVHRNLKDSIIYDPAGNWMIRNDTLIIQDTFPTQVTYKYRIKVNESIAEFWGTEDFDQDGKIDDQYYSKQRKLE